MTQFVIHMHTRASPTGSRHNMFTSGHAPKSPAGASGTVRQSWPFLVNSGHTTTVQAAKTPCNPSGFAS